MAGSGAGAVLVGQRLVYNLIGLGLLTLVLAGLGWARRHGADDMVVPSPA